MYYILCIIAISLSLSLFFSAIMPFIMDIGQIITVIFQILFWVTPIFWDKSILIGNNNYIIKLNPFAYIVDGVRDTIFDQVPFWNNYKQVLYFWCFVLVVLWIGNRTFNKLRPHFADVL